MRIEAHADISKLSNYRTSASAARLIHIEKREDLINLPRELGPYYLIGGGSNTLFKKAHYDETFIHLGSFKGIEWKGEALHVGAGEMLPSVAREFEKRNLGGMEELLMIPGTLGAAVIMNAGAHKSEISQILVEIEIFSLNERTFKRIPLTDLKVNYRAITGIPKDAIITLAVLRPLQRPFDKELCDKARAFRVGKFPPRPNCGSVFKNPPNDFAGRLIEACGLKGFEINGARVSLEHANIFENYNQATGEAMFELFETVKKRVFEKFSVELEYEVKIFG